MKHLFFNSVSEYRPKMRDMLWGEFVKTLCPLVNIPKTRAPLFLAAETVQHPETKIYGRKKSDILYRTMLVVDYDHGVPSDIFEIFKEKLKGSAFFAYTTFNHGVNGENRCRLIVPLEKPATPGEFDFLTADLIKKIGVSADPCTKKVSQLMYYPLKTKNFVSYEGKGDLYKSHFTLGGTYEPMITATITANPIGQQFYPDIKVLLESKLNKIYKKGDAPYRYTFIGGGGTNGLEVGSSGWQVRSHHSTDPINSLGWCGAYELVKIHLCNNDDDATMAWFTQTEHCTTPETIEKLFSRTRDGKRDFKKDTDVIIALQNDSKLKNLFYTDEYTEGIRISRDQRLLNNNLIRKTSNSGWLSDTTLNEACRYLVCTYNFTQSDERLHNLIRHVAGSNVKHRSKEFIESAPWDGIDRFEEIPKRAQFELNSFTEVALKNWMVSLITSIYSGRYSRLDAMLIFQGGGGEGKTSLCEMLGGHPEFTAMIDTGEFMSSGIPKDFNIKITGSMVSYFDEFRQVTGKAKGSLKTLITQSTVKFRNVYAKLERVYTREFGLAACTTSTALFDDFPEGRRFWIIPVHGRCIEIPEKLEYFKKCVSNPYYRQQLWAQALALYKAGYDFHLSARQEKDRESILRRYRQYNKYETSFAEYFDNQDAPLNGVGINIAKYMSDQGLPLNDDQYAKRYADIARQLVNLGYRSEFRELTLKLGNQPIKKDYEIYIK